MLDYMLMPLRRYAEFGGRSRRKEYWYYTLFLIILSVVAAIIDAVLFGAEDGLGIVGIVLTLATLVPGIAVSVRRLHDTDRSGWWLLILLIPLIGVIVVIVFTVMDGTPGPNKFGPSPKGLG